MNKIKMQKQILESEGSKCIGKMRYHNITIEILKKNYLELTKSLNYFERFENSLKLMVQSNREEADKYHNEVTRLLHNFLASTKTLIDHTRIFFEKNYSRDEVFKHYKEKIEIEFKNDELSRFIQDLRNYILHRGLPYTGMLLKANLETTVYLDRDLMLEWSKWTAPSRNYLLA